MRINKPFTPLRLFDNIKMRHKLLLIYFVLIIIPMSFFTYLIYSRISGVMQEQTLNSGTQVFEESANILNKDFDSASTVIKVITGAETIYDIMLRTYVNHDAIEEIKDKHSMADLFIYLKSNTNLDDIHLYTFGEKIIYDDNSVLTNINHIENAPWYKALISGNINTIWVDPVSNTDFQSSSIDKFSIANIIYNPEKLSQRIAIIKVDIEGKRIDDIIKNTLITSNCITYIVNDSTLIRSTASFEATGKVMLKTDQLPVLADKGWNTVKSGNTQSFVNVRLLNANGWYLVTSMPTKDVAVIAKKFRSEMLLAMVFISLAALLLAYFISSSTVKRLSLLSGEMKKVESGITEIFVNKQGTDEIGELMEDFNYMVSKINTLAEEKYNLGIEIKSSELKALQAQINPHFLYNTLDMINCTALMNNVPEIAAQVTALAKFYRLSLNRGSDIVTVREELEHVKTYVQIQNMRFQNRIAFNITSSDDVMNCKTFKIILQPIVENSIIHGIFEKDSKSGTINIAAFKDGNSIFFSIEDDGVGIPEEKLKGLLNYEMPVIASGYGIKNIDMRIRLYYGQEYGLTYSSRPNAGTKVVVRIPAVYM